MAGCQLLFCSVHGIHVAMYGKHRCQKVPCSRSFLSLRMYMCVCAITGYQVSEVPPRLDNLAPSSCHLHLWSVV